MRRYWILPASMVLGLAAGCGSGTAPDAEQELRVEAEPGQVAVVNTGHSVVSFLLANPDALIQLTGPADWPTLMPGASAITPNEEIVGWTPGTTHAVVYWAVGGQERDPFEVRLR